MWRSNISGFFFFILSIDWSRFSQAILSLWKESADGCLRIQTQLSCWLVFHSGGLIVNPHFFWSTSLAWYFLYSDSIPVSMIAYGVLHPGPLFCASQNVWGQRLETTGFAKMWQDREKGESLVRYKPQQVCLCRWASVSPFGVWC